jgi:hypothetical protein
MSVPGVACGGQELYVGSLDAGPSPSIDRTADASPFDVNVAPPGTGHDPGSAPDAGPSDPSPQGSVPIPDASGSSIPPGGADVGLGNADIAALKATCARPRGTLHAYANAKELAQLLVGRWYLCSGNVIGGAGGSRPPAADVQGITFAVDNRWAILSIDNAGAITRRGGMDYEGSWVTGDDFSQEFPIGKQPMAELVFDNQRGNELPVLVFSDNPSMLEFAGALLVPMP